MVHKSIMSSFTPKGAFDTSMNSNNAPRTPKDAVLYRTVKSVKAGQMNRFDISYTPDTKDMITRNLWVKVKNTEPIAMRAAFIAGPYLLYVDCRAEDYNQNQKCFVTADQPSYDSQLQPGKSFYCELSCHTIKDTYKWTVDVMSQMIFNSSFDINFEVSVGTSKEALHEQEHVKESSNLSVHCLDTFELWNLPVPNPTKPIHLVILTHGLHSNVATDLFYLKEQIDGCNGHERDDNIVVKGFFGNICKTERGVKYLGSRVGEFIIDLLTNNKTFSDGKVTKISFIGHSLGGVVQTFAIAYLQINFPWFFRKIKPINFVTIASPMLGASNENPIYVNLALSAGIVGKTGQDLSLRYIEDNGKPLLLLLPSGPTHQVLKKFVRRTIYANTINDGVVPLRTSGLLYLDYDGLSTILDKKSIDSHHITSAKVDKIPDDDCVDKADESMLPQPLQMIFSKFMPQKQKVNQKDKQVDETAEESTSKKLLRRIDGLHNSSVLETAQLLILPPLPPLSYIVNPEERQSAIIYDKVYYEKDLPPRTSDSGVDNTVESPVLTQSQATTFRKRLLSSFDVKEFEIIEEEIAREYHKGMSWRKVLIRLEADAHNNIIVRRRFANAYGWPVIEHLISNHFNESDQELETNQKLWNLNAIGMWDDDSLNNDTTLVEILSRDLIRKENRDIEIQDQDREHKWINSKDADSFFNTGPASFISDFSDAVANLRDQWYNSQETTALKPAGFKESGFKEASGFTEDMDVDEEYEKDISHQIIGDFV